MQTLHFFWLNKSLFFDLTLLEKRINHIIFWSSYGKENCKNFISNFYLGISHLNDFTEKIAVRSFTEFHWLQHRQRTEFKSKSVTRMKWLAIPNNSIQITARSVINWRKLKTATGYLWIQFGFVERVGVCMNWCGLVHVEFSGFNTQSVCVLDDDARQWTPNWNV